MRAPTIPNATPQTATRRTRSQSPPSRVQRMPVRPTQAAIASSSISPHMWRGSGRMSMTRVCGQGSEATNGPGGIVPAPSGRRYREGLQQDAERRLGRAAPFEQPDGEVEVDVVACGQLRGVLGVEPGPLQLVRAPLLDPLRLRLDLDVKVCRCHVRLR